MTKKFLAGNFWIWCPPPWFPLMTFHPKILQLLKKLEQKRKNADLRIFFETKMDFFWKNWKNSIYFFVADQTWAIFWQRYNDGKIKLMALLILVWMSLIRTHTSIPTLTHSLAHSGSVLHAHTHASTSHPPIHTHAPKDRAQLRSRIPHVWSFVESYLAALLKFKTQPQACHEIQFF